jgi:hypothetical protein
MVLHSASATLLYNHEEQVMSETAQTLTEAPESDHEVSLVEEELPVEGVWIDAMCGGC